MVLQKHNNVHVLLLPYPAQGHINPLVQFAKRLASKGVKATIATTHYTVNTINAPNVGVEAISDGFDNGGFAQAKNVQLFLTSFRTVGAKTLSQLIERFQQTTTPVTCIVYDSFFPWALDVAKRHGVYGAAFFTNSAAVCNIFCRIHHGLLELPVEEEDLPLFVPGIPPLDLPDLPSFIRFPESYPDYLAMKLSQFSNLNKADFMFVNTFEALESEAVNGIRELCPAKLIGPMVPSAYLDGRIKGDRGYGASLWKPLSEECSDWLETKASKSVVYISFGSMVSLSNEQIEEVALGLEQSGMNFIWVLRQSEHAKLPKGYEEMVKEKGIIVTWCNQLELLEHQAIGCFVTHCGWNSTLETLSLGVPVVCLPQWADQLPDAKYLEQVWEVGVRPKEDESGVVRKEEFVRSLKMVMEGKRSEEIRSNASKWMKLAREAVGEGGSSDKNINEFVEHLRGAHVTANLNDY
ncbi:UDP-glycosyltransferase 74B1-like [Arachis stenosperma]|uniref:UDP-glycosyltransferase 74B1-like n=1 Tax=Arachis stenosperma TaxID=217475 RepID=UPI0025AB8EEB|nr:UDP-glycosyltransferase 74B1-like [Arachis stenosperma]